MESDPNNARRLATRQDGSHGPRCVLPPVRRNRDPAQGEQRAFGCGFCPLAVSGLWTSVENGGRQEIRACNNHQL